MVGVPNLSAYIYIYPLQLEFNLPVLPETITDSLPVQFNTQEVLARSAPQITFSSAGPRSQQVILKLHRHLFALENTHLDTITKKPMLTMQDPVTAKMVETTVTDAADFFINAMLTLSVPKYTDSIKAIVPPSLLIRFGNESCIRGVPNNFQKTASGAWLKNGKLAEITLSFSVIETEPFSAQYVAQNGTLRSLSTTLERGSVWQF